MEAAEDPGYDAAVAALRAPPKPSKLGAWLPFLISLALFAWATHATDPAGVGIIVAVLLFHELGHFVAMKAFGYTDVRMFFIPFFGAAVSGKAEGIAPWKRATVLLAGPAPGIVGAVVLLKLPLTGGAWQAALVGTLLYVNLFNLLPIVPFDGGKLFELIAFGRSAAVELVVVALSAIALGALALVSKSIALGVIAYFTLVGVGARARIAGWARAFLAEVPRPTPRLEDAPDEELRALYRATPQAVIGSRAIMMRNAHARAVLPRPNLATASAVLGAYAAVAALGILAVWPAIQVATASDELDQVATVEALTVRYPGSFRRNPLDGGLSIDRGNEAVIISSHALEPGLTVEQELRLRNVSLMAAMPVKAGESAANGQGLCAGIAAPTATWRSELGGIVLRVETCAVVHAGRSYVLVTMADDALDVRTSAKIAAAAHF